jgi:hypothetical protein
MGTGVDARSDPNDGYQFANGFSFMEIQRISVRVKNTVLFKIVKFIESSGTRLLKAPRYAKR